MDSSHAVRTRKKKRMMKLMIKTERMRKRIINDKKIKPISECLTDEDFS